MRISDWSSDVCSSDLRDDLRREDADRAAGERTEAAAELGAKGGAGQCDDDPQEFISVLGEVRQGVGDEGDRLLADLDERPIQLRPCRIEEESGRVGARTGGA